jgi:outer membrane receptor for ferrienterochelin and colicin
LPHDTETGEAAVRLDALPTDALRLDWVYRFAGVDSKLPVRDPGATRAPLDPNARNERDRQVTALTAHFLSSPGWQHRLRASYCGEDFLYDDRKDDVPPSPEFFVFDANFSLDGRLARPALEYSADVRLGGGGGVFTYGASWERERLRDRTAGDFGASRQVLRRSSRAGFAEVQLRPSARIDVLAGLRAEKYEGLEVSVTPRASAVVQLEPDALSLRLAAGRAYKAPKLQEQFLDNPFIVSNPDFEPETSTSVEAGLDLSGRGGFTAGLTLFRQDYRDLIRAVGLEDGTGRQQNRNLGVSRAQGVEWRAAYRAERWAASTSGTWLRTEIRDAAGLPPGSFPEGEALPFRPSVVAGASLELDVTDRFRALVRADAMGRQIVRSARFSGRRVTLDPYVLTGLVLNWDATTRWQLYARIDNLLGAEYETGYDRRGLPATAALGFRWRIR